MATANPQHGSENAPKNFHEVFTEEKKLIGKESGEPLIGLAFSGGGIRSATFNLGIIQALAKSRLLDKFDYLSAVSGGTFASGWLSSWAKREGEKNGEECGRPGCGKSFTKCQNGESREYGIKEVQRKLGNEDPSSLPEPPEVSWLRRYSNYLTPRKGLFSLDTLTGIIYHIRNVFLSGLVVGLFAFGVFALTAGAIREGASINAESFGAVVSAMGLAIGFLATLLIWCRLPLVAASSPHSADSKWAVEIIAALVVLFSIILGVVGISPLYEPSSIAQTHGMAFDWRGGLILSAGYAIPALLGMAVAQRKYKKLNVSASHVNWGKLYFSAIPGAFFFLALGGLLPQLALDNPWELIGISAPIVCLLVSFTMSIHLGIVGRAISSEAYFWISRVGGRMVQYSMVTLLPATFLIFPPLIEWSEAQRALGGASLLFAIAARGFAASPATGEANGKSKGWQQRITEMFVSSAPFILIILLVGFVSWGVRTSFSDSNNKQYFEPSVVKNHEYSCKEKTVISTNSIPASPLTHNSIRKNELSGESSKLASCIPSLSNYYALNRDILNNNFNAFSSLIYGITSLALAIFLAWRIDANLFSLHSYYKNRLTNAYLAASNREVNETDQRDVNTGLHPSDAIPLQCLTDVKPYLLVNTALNLSGNKTELAWQDRKATSFLMSPLYCGYVINHLGKEKGLDSSRTKFQREDFFQKTSEFSKYACYPMPIKLNQAITISGAAGSPMGGFHTKPGVSMLLALTGVRLGWWLANPAKTGIWQGSPDKGTSLLNTFPKEMAASASNDGDVVYLSDGGHFENLGIYELVRRRCTLIVASDVGADSDYVFDDLARAIHNIRTDFGVEIEIDISPLRPQPSATGVEEKYRFSPQSYVIGEIKYHTSPLDEFRNSPAGKLILIKPSIPAAAKKEALDVLYYASTHEKFPQEPTADQWFSEEQFEAYRKLGFMLGMETASAIRKYCLDPQCAPPAESIDATAKA